MPAGMAQTTHWLFFFFLVWWASQSWSGGFVSVFAQ
jgi:hypothetical protein